ncbi:hypothetical protein PISMIDRAFT_57206, partial [Pisolithus microcarpus 441]
HCEFTDHRSTFVPEEDPSCPCGEPMQTRERIVASCPLFENSRSILRTASDDLIISDLLGMEKGIEALVEFL